MAPIIIILFLGIGVWDIKYKKIPNAFLLVLLFLAVAEKHVFENVMVQGNVLDLLMGSFIFFLLWIVIGAGDAKFLIILSYIFSIEGALIIFAFSVIIFVFFVLATNRKKIIESLNMIKNLILYQLPLKKMNDNNEVAYSPFIIGGILILLGLKINL